MTSAFKLLYSIVSKNPSFTSPKHNMHWTVLVQEYHRGNTCIIQLDLIWDQLLSPLPLLVSRHRNGTCQNKGSEIRLEQSWAGHLGGRLSISHTACCLLRSHTPLRNCVQKCKCVCVSDWVKERKRHQNSLLTARHQDRVRDQATHHCRRDTPPGQPSKLSDKNKNWQGSLLLCHYS